MLVGEFGSKNEVLRRREGEREGREGRVELTILGRVLTFVFSSCLIFQKSQMYSFYIGAYPSSRSHLTRPRRLFFAKRAAVTNSHFLLFFFRRTAYLPSQCLPLPQPLLHPPHSYSLLAPNTPPFPSSQQLKPPPATSNSPKSSGCSFASSSSASSPGLLLLRPRQTASHLVGGRDHGLLLLLRPSLGTGKEGEGEGGRGEGKAEGGDAGRRDSGERWVGCLKGFI